MKTKVLFCGRSKQFAAVIKECVELSNMEISGYVLPLNKSFTEECITVANLYEVPIFSTHHEIDFVPDLVISMYYDRIFKSDFLLKCKVVNLHNSILPHHRGLRPISYAFALKDPEIGCTLHIVDDGIDTGPIISQAKFELDHSSDENNVREKIMDLGKSLLLEFLISYPNFSTFNQELNSGSYHSYSDALKDGMI
jgi:methionyl-tRNA formyltransferase